LEEAREHSTLEETAEATAVSLLLLKGRVPTILPTLKESEAKVNVLLNGEVLEVTLQEIQGGKVRFTLGGRCYLVEFESSVPTSKESSSKKVAKVSSHSGALLAPIPGVVSNILVQVGDLVSAEDPLFRLEAMKMQNAIPSGKSGKVTKIFVSVGQEVAAGEALAEIE